MNYSKKQTKVIEATYNHIKETMSGEGSGHDFWHIHRVWKNAKAIASKENCNTYIVELGALLHDIADFKFHNGDTTVGPRVTGEFLCSLDVEPEIIDAVCYIVANVSFKGAKVKSSMNTIEGLIVQDADRLDAIGAIGIARTFAYGGSKSRVMYDPNSKPVLHDTFEAYKNSEGCTINHFYEKLLLLKDMMNTNTAKEMAVHRHKVMEEFLTEFYEEWDGIL